MAETPDELMGVLPEVEWDHVAKASVYFGDRRRIVLLDDEFHLGYEMPDHSPVTRVSIQISGPSHSTAEAHVMFLAELLARVGYDDVTAGVLAADSVSSAYALNGGPVLLGHELGETVENQDL